MYVYVYVYVSASVRTCSITTRLHMYHSLAIHKLHIRDENDVYHAYRAYIHMCVCVYVCCNNRFVFHHFLQLCFSTFFFPFFLRLPIHFSSSSFFNLFVRSFSSSDSSTRSREQLAGNREENALSPASPSLAVLSHPFSDGRAYRCTVYLWQSSMANSRESRSFTI